MGVQQIEISGLTCSLFLPQNYHEGNESYPVIYINGDVPTEEMIGEVRKAESKAEFILLAIQPGSWNDDFTPWSAPAFRKGEEAPKGLAAIYVSRVAEEIKPYMDTNYRTKPEPEYTALCGYSLGGLTAVYAIYKTDVFGMIGSISGSLWYDGFCEFMEREQPLRKNMKVYLSLGKKESSSRNLRMCKVAECTERARDILADRFRPSDCGSDMMRGQACGSVCIDSTQAEAVCFEWNEGGHFHDIPKRFAKAVKWWMTHMPG